MDPRKKKTIIKYLDQQILKVEGVSVEEGAERHEEYYVTLVKSIREQWAKVAKKEGHSEHE